MEEVDLELRRRAGHLQTFQTELRHRTDEVRRLSAFILEKAAETVASLWSTEQEVDCSEVLSNMATEVALEMAAEVRVELLKVQTLLQQELSKAATLLRSTDTSRSEDFQVLSEMPVFHMNRQNRFASRPLLSNLGQWFRVRAASRTLETQADSLSQALESFSRLLYSWGLDASSDLERRFDSFANRYRAQLERLLLDRNRPTVDYDCASSDLQSLATMFVAEPATNNEAIAS